MTPGKFVCEKGYGGGCFCHMRDGNLFFFFFFFSLSRSVRPFDARETQMQNPGNVFVFFFCFLKGPHFADGRTDRFGIDHTLRAQQCFGPDGHSETGFADRSYQQEQDQTTEYGESESGFQIDLLFVPPAIVQEVELDHEKDGEDGLQHFRHDAGIIEIFEAHFARRLVADDLGRGIETADDDVRCEARQPLDGGRTHQTPALVVDQSVHHLTAARALGQFLADHVGVLDGLATTLSEVRHHGVNAISQQRHGSIHPRFHDGRGPIVQVTLFDFIFFGHLQDVVYLGGPPFKDALQIGRRSIGHGSGGCRIGWTGQEGVPLVSAIPDIGDDKVL